MSTTCISATLYLNQAQDHSEKRWYRSEISDRDGSGLRSLCHHQRATTKGVDSHRQDSGMLYFSNLSMMIDDVIFCSVQNIVKIHFNLCECLDIELMLCS